MKLKLERIVLFSVAYCFVLHDNLLYVAGTSSSKSKKGDFYEELEIDKNANEKQIKRAFYRRATKYHPDKNKDEGAEDKFRDIARAYEVLSNPDERKRYDRIGHAAYVSGSGGRGGGGGGGGSFNFGSFEDLFRHFNEPFGHEGNSFHFSFGGNDFDDFWPDNDEEDPFSSFGFGEQFGGGHFGGGDSFFRTHFGHGNEQSHETEEHRGYKESRASSSGRSCRTVTQRVGNMVTTYTQCS